MYSGSKTGVGDGWSRGEGETSNLSKWLRPQPSPLSLLTSPGCGLTGRCVLQREKGTLLNTAQTAARQSQTGLGIGTISPILSADLSTIGDRIGQSFGLEPIFSLPDFAPVCGPCE